MKYLGWNVLRVIVAAYTGVSAVGWMGPTLDANPELTRAALDFVVLIVVVVAAMKLTIWKGSET